MVFLVVVASVVVGWRLLGPKPAEAAGTSAGTLADPTASDSGAVYDFATPSQAPIPSDALRLRIIANSDSTVDQTLKLEIRDAVVTETGQWLQGAKSAAEARQIVQTHLPAIRSLAMQVEQQHGYHYPVSATIGEVPFPTKMYGNRVYPAGNYDALRITLGSGQGQNWWCVLFPPLCFVDIADGDAVPNTGAFPDLPPLETIQVPSVSGKTVPVQVRAATIDYGEEVVQSIRHWLN